MNIVFSGSIGRCTTGGGAWEDLQYLVGFRQLGHQVTYLEDWGIGDQVWDFEKNEWTQDLAVPGKIVNQWLADFGFERQWVARSDSQMIGPSAAKLRDLCASADLLIIRGIPLWTWREEYDLPHRRAFIDIDPGFVQMSMAKDPVYHSAVVRAEKLFTVGLRTGYADCKIPTLGLPWLQTLPPVALTEWHVVQAPGGSYTSVMRWRGFRDEVYEGETYGQKDKEFPKFFDLPRLVKQPLLLAAVGAEEIEQHGWNIIDGHVASRTPQVYREFIQASKGEFSVAKNCYVKMRSGWFSDRSVCYLASGKPAILQDTGVTDCIPTGEGIVTFSDLPSAIEALAEVDGNYAKHSKAARRLAEEIFSTDIVLPKLLERAMS